MNADATWEGSSPVDRLASELCLSYIHGSLMRKLWRKDHCLRMCGRQGENVAFPSGSARIAREEQGHEVGGGISMLHVPDDDE